MYNFYHKILARPLECSRTGKILLLMKLTTLMMIFGILQVSATTFAQKVTLKERNASLKTIFNQISSQTGYDFVVTSDLLAQSHLVTIDVKGTELKEVLTKIFSDQPFDFTIQEKTVVVSKKEVSLIDKTKNSIKTVQPPKFIYGKVVDEKGLPMPGVTIRLKGTQIGGVSNLDGQFVIGITKPDDILQIGFVGYITQEIAVSSMKSPATIVLKEDLSKLDEVEVIGYGTTTRRDNVGDVTTVNAKTIAQYPTTNVLDVLQGSVPGVNISKSTGNVTGTYKVQIRGINGLTTANPLYVIDGVPYLGGGQNSRNSTSGNNSVSGQLGQAYDAMSLINPDDIESISILKDADATAIYGSRGADGVILITTKKGKAGNARIDANVYTGISDVAHFQNMLNLQQYLEMRHEAKANDKSAISATDYDINGVWDTTRSTNWQKELIGGYGHNTNAQLAISGGNDQTVYRISSGYNVVSGLEHLGGNDQTANLNVSLTSSTKDKKFSVSFNGGYLYDINTMTNGDLTSEITFAPDAPALYTSTGALNFQNNTFTNPLVLKNAINNTSQNNLTSSLVLSYKPIKDLEIALTTGYNKQGMNEYLGLPSTAYQPSYNFPPSSDFTYNNSYSWSIEPQVNYHKQISKGKLSATVGASLQDQSSSSLSLTSTGYSSSLLLSSPTGGTTIVPYEPYYVSPIKTSGLYGRINYSWADKYYVDLSGRNDGSSNFGENRQYHLFSAIGAGWIFSEEGFIKDNLPFLNFGKLRGSYGSTGRDQIAPYSYLSTYGSYTTAVPYGGVAGLAPSQLPNPDLSWETTKKAELGMELQFLKGRIAFTTDFYRNRTSGELGSNPISYVTGFSTFTENLPATVQNAGFDATLTTANIRSTNFSWTTTFLFTRDRNKLLSYPNLASSSNANRYVIGQPVDIIKAYRFAGVNPQTGTYQFYTANGGITSSPTPNIDNTALININPDFYGSIQNNISYKQFTLSFLFRYIKQTGRNAFYGIGGAPPGLIAGVNYPTLVLDRWQKPGDITNIQRYGTSFNLLFTQTDAVESNFAYGDASYIRLQNLSLSYTLPQAFAHKIGMQHLQVYLQGDNLWTITGYNGLDPETQTPLSLPSLRVMTMGLKLTL